MLGITVDNSTKGLSDKVISNTTVQAIKAAETNEGIKTESTTTAVKNTVTENSQGGSSDASAISCDKESETNSDVNVSSNIEVNTDNSIENSTPVIDPAAIQAENEQLKAQLASIVNLAAVQA